MRPLPRWKLPPYSISKNSPSQCDTVRVSHLHLVCHLPCASCQENGRSMISRSHQDFCSCSSSNRGARASQVSGFGCDGIVGGSVEGRGEGASSSSTGSDTTSSGVALGPALSDIRCDSQDGSSAAEGVCGVGKLDNGMPTRSRASSSKTMPH